MKPTFRLFLLAAPVLVGCASLQALLPVDSEPIHDAKKRGDVEYLRKICSGELRAKYEVDKADACAAVEQKQALAGADNGNCDDVVARYEAAPKNDEEFVTAMGKQFAKCGKFKELFEQISHWGNNQEGARILAKVEDSGVALEAEFLKYAKENAGRGFMDIKAAKYGMSNIGIWLMKKNRLGHCAAIASAVSSAKETVRAWAFPYFREAKCKEAQPIAAEMLLSDSPDYRAWSCQTLAVVGDASMLKKVATLGETDGFSVVREQSGADGRVWGVKVFPVREACTEAAGKIKIRAL